VITHTVHVITRPSEHDRFVAAARALRDASVGEEGNVEYSLWTPLDGGHEVLVVERWRDQAAVEAHQAAPHMAAFRAAVKGAVAAPPTNTRAVDESDQAGRPTPAEQGRA
jgi:quinol monooxygenase YgiN